MTTGDAPRRYRTDAEAVRELQAILIDNTHALRTILHGESPALPCSPKEAWERTLDELRALMAQNEGAEATIQRAIDEWAAIAIAPESAGNDVTLAHHIATSLRYAALTEGGAG